MTAARLLAALALGSLAAGCGHTKTVADEGAAKAEEPGEHAAPPHHRDAPARHRPSTVASARSDDGHPAATAGKFEAPPLTTSPAGLLKPGALKTIQERLSGDGLPADQATGELNAATREALARFQSRHNLPATGAPDDATIRKLGLKPDDVFKTAQR